jgi:hypothetical protein
MKKPHKNFLRIVVVGLVFALISLGLFYRQIRRNDDQVSGKVRYVDQGNITIIDSTNNKIELKIDEKTMFRDGGDWQNNKVEIDMFIHSFGERIDKYNFYSHGIRIVKNR